MRRAPGIAIAALLLWSIAQAQPARRSGFDDMSPATQAMQRDDTQNPAMLWVADGRQRFATDCTRCHDEAAMRGAAARHPAFDARAGKAVTLAGRINTCRERELKQPPWPAEHEVLLGLEAYLASLSRGLPVAPPSDPRLVPARTLGAALWTQRFGQLGLACAECHDRAAGAKLGGSTIPQGHPTAYPIYRLEWQALGSLQRRFRNCMVGVRAEPFAPDSPEAVALEAFLKQRAAGLPWEGPGVRP